MTEEKELNVTSFELLVEVNTKKTLRWLREDEMQLVFENPNTGKRRKETVKKNDPKFRERVFRLKPQMEADNDGPEDAA